MPLHTCFLHWDHFKTLTLPKWLSVQSKVPHKVLPQGLKLCFGNDLTNPVMWLDMLNSTVQKLSKSIQTLARNGQKMADVQPQALPPHFCVAT